MRIAMVCPNVSSNSLVRTYAIAKVLARHHELQMLGFRFGDGVFEPYREEFDFETMEGGRFPRFLSAVRRMVERIRADAIYVFKPLPSSLWVGLLARRALGVPLFLDIEEGVVLILISSPRGQPCEADVRLGRSRVPIDR